MEEEKKRPSRLPFSSILAIILLFVVGYWFLFGDMYRFYASAVFLFYSWTNQMWVSVMMLGVFQTFLLIPLRIIRLLDFKNVRDFASETIRMRDTGSQESHLKEQFKQGNWAFILYLLDFVIQLTTYMTIGRLFLTNFYTKALHHDALFSFVPYPEYPILDRFFKIPYPGVTKTMDFGFEAVVYMWLIILVVELVVSLIRGIIKARRNRRSETEQKTDEKSNGALSGKYLIVYGVILYGLSYLLLRNFPVAWEIKIFTGDVAIQNRTFNTITAIATFLTLMWFGINDILKKGKIARDLGLPQRVIEATQMRLFKEKFSSAALIGLGAYFITNQIPCAFELSIFTLEIISLFSPLTLDRWILKAAPRREGTEVLKVEREKRDVKEQFSGKIEE
ncbi:MAG TPA: hypothetical protein PLI45_00285 [Candidatus Woesebacteria bacterium]|nr:hypothetical protein [Candidatus Woesebacteria bacterium]